LDDLFILIPDSSEGDVKPLRKGHVEEIRENTEPRDVQRDASQMEYAPKVESEQILSFYMGKNTPERKDYIMENLVVTVEE
jgi:hypothetical protein